MFDGYYHWLGIPPEEQPPNHYRLLGLRDRESEAGVIDTAANKQMSYLHGCATGEHAEVAEKLMNEVAAARLCLLNTESKAAYDARLLDAAKTQAPPDPPPTASIAAPQTNNLKTPQSGIAEPDLRNVHGESQPVAKVSISTARRRRSRMSPVMVGLGIVAVLCLGVLAILLNEIRNAEDIGGSLVTSATGGGEQPEIQEPSDTSAGSVAQTSNATQVGEQPVSPDGNDVATQETGMADSSTDPDTSVSLEQPNAGSLASGSDDQQNSNLDNAQPSASSGSLAELMNGEGTPNSQDGNAETPTIARIPKPSDAELERARSMVKELYGDQYEKAKTPMQRVELGKQLHAQALDFEKPADQFAMLTVAREVLRGAQEYVAAFTVIDDLESRYEYDGTQDRLGMLLVCSRGQLAAENGVLGESAEGFIDSLLQADRFDDAMNLATHVAGLYSETTSSSMGKRAIKRQRELVAMQAEYEKCRGAIDILALNPDDAEACLLVGRYRLFVLKNVDAGIALLAKSDAPGLSEAAKSELDSTSSPLATADLWYKAAESETESQHVETLKRRAAAWYRKALPDLTGLAKSKAELRSKGYPEEDSNDGRANVARGVVQYKIHKPVNSPGAIATRERNDFFVQTTSGNSSSTIGAFYRGEAAVGVELRDVMTMSVETKVVRDGAQAATRSYNSHSTSLAGFVVDYHTTRGYTKRVFFDFQRPANTALNGQGPLWGTARPPDDHIPMGKEAVYRIDLWKYAPKDWDFQVWFSLYARDLRTDLGIASRVSWQYFTPTQRRRYKAAVSQ